MAKRVQYVPVEQLVLRHRRELTTVQQTILSVVTYDGKTGDGMQPEQITDAVKQMSPADVSKQEILNGLEALFNEGYLVKEKTAYHRTNPGKDANCLWTWADATTIFITYQGRNPRHEAIVYSWDDVKTYVSELRRRGWFTVVDERALLDFVASRYGSDPGLPLGRTPLFAPKPPDGKIGDTAETIKCRRLGSENARLQSDVQRLRGENTSLSYANVALQKSIQTLRDENQRHKDDNIRLQGDNMRLQGMVEGLQYATQATLEDRRLHNDKENLRKDCKSSQPDKSTARDLRYLA